MGFQERTINRIEGNRQQARKVTFAEYIAQHNFDAANRFLTSNGYPPSSAPYELAQRLGAFITQNGDKGLQAVMILHPDREEILSQTYGFNIPNYNNAMGPQYNNCAGCGGTCGGSNNHNNATGPATTQPTQNLWSTEKSLNTLAVVALVGIVFLAAIRNA